MKKLIFILMIVGLIGTGCANRSVVQSEAPVQKPATTAGVKEHVTAPKVAQVTPQVNVNEKELPEVQRLKKELQGKLKDIHFNFDKSELESDAKPVLNDLANILSKHPILKVIVEGNCDDRGTREYNLALGEKRASAAKQYLISRGIPSAKIDTISYGKEKPLCPESTDECWAKNRRDHFVLN